MSRDLKTGLVNLHPDRERGEVLLIDLMRRYQAGDRRAFETLYQHLSPKLRRFLRWCGPSPDRLEDLVQESFLQLHRSRHTYRPDRPVTPWALAIANYVQLMERRALKSRIQTQDADDWDADEISSALGNARSLSERLKLKSAFSRIEPDQRSCFVLHHVWGYSFHEIASILGISRGAAKNRSFRAARELRSLLSEPA